MKKEEKEFHPGQLALIMGMRSGARKEGVVFSVDSLNIIDPKIAVRNSGGEVSFNKKTLRGETVLGPCVLMHVRAWDEKTNQYTPPGSLRPGGFFYF